MAYIPQPDDRILQGQYPFAKSDKNREARLFGIPLQSLLDQQGPLNHSVSSEARTREMEQVAPSQA